MKNNKYEIDMVNGSIMDKLISFALPLMISGILQLAFNAVDIIVVGQQITCGCWLDYGTYQCVCQSVYGYIAWCECARCPILCGRQG